MQERYKKNIGFITEEHQNILLTKTVGLIGVGGTGGYILEFLARLGLKKIIIFDGDNFEISNLNRQRFCNEYNIEKLKAQEAFDIITNINSSIEYEYYNRFFTAQDIELLKQCDIIIHAADGNIYTSSCRSALRELIIEKNIPILEVYGTLKGSACRISTINSIDKFDAETESWLFNAKNKEKNIDFPISQPAYLCGLAAALAVSELYKYFCNIYNPAIDRIVCWDMENNKLYCYS